MAQQTLLQLPRGRPRSFDLEAAVECAMNVFWSRGYHATALPDLLRATKLSRGSLYAAFGGKHALFLRALDRYIAAFENYDIDALVKMFTEEAIWEMPPFDGWYQGPEAIVTLTRVHCPAEGPGDMRFIRTTANGQPAAALYMINRETGKHEAFQLHVLDVKTDGVSHVVAFLDTSLFEKFGLPASL